MTRVIIMKNSSSCEDFWKPVCLEFCPARSRLQSEQKAFSFLLDFVSILQTGSWSFFIYQKTMYEEMRLDVQNHRPENLSLRLTLVQNLKTVSKIQEWWVRWHSAAEVADLPCLRPERGSVKRSYWCVMAHFLHRPMSWPCNATVSWRPLTEALFMGSLENRL